MIPHNFTIGRFGLIQHLLSRGFFGSWSAAFSHRVSTRGIATLFPILSSQSLLSCGCHSLEFWSLLSVQVRFDPPCLPEGHAVKRRKKSNPIGLFMLRVPRNSLFHQQPGNLQSMRCLFICKLTVSCKNFVVNLLAFMVAVMAQVQFSTVCLFQEMQSKKWCLPFQTGQ